MSTEDKHHILRADRPIEVLQAGIRTLRVKQKVTGDAGGREYTHDIDIEVRLERFAPPEVTFRHPQPGSRFPYFKTIPHIVLSKAVLPWERTAAGPSSETSPRPPWLMLLAFAGEKRPKKIHFEAVSDLAKGPNAELGEDILKKYGPEKSELGGKCRYIDVPWDLFKKLSPLGEELAALVHIQQAANEEDLKVQTAREALAAAEEKKDSQKITASRAALKAAEMARTASGCPPQSPPVAILLNRYSVGEVIRKCDAPTDREVPIEVHLVSVEGMESLLASPSRDPQRNIRLLSLNTWSFIHDGKRAGAGFEDRCRKLTAGELGASISFKGARHSLQYRGPLLSRPNDTPSTGVWNDPDKCLFQSEDGARVDISFAAAWQMGRLVAMGDPDLGGEFAKLRAHWRYRKAVRKGNLLAMGIPAGAGLDAREERNVAALLRRLWLLEKVPLHYLIADPEMLPPEKICVVHVDPMWADAWCGGAFSVGSLAAADYTLQSPEAAAVLRKSNLPEWRSNGVSGILLRSEIISEWPQLRVDFWNGSKLLGADDLLRKEKLAPDLLLVLVKGQFSKVRLSVPSDTHYFEADSGVVQVSENKAACRATSVAQAYQKVEMAVEFPVKQ